MLTRLQIQGFKNLLDVDIRFGPFTCIAGLNGSGKSNVFDAISLLSHLTEMPIMEAMKELRETSSSITESTELLSRFDCFQAAEMRIAADLVVNRESVDDFGVKSTAAISSLRYEIAFRPSRVNRKLLEIADESLRPVKQREAARLIGFPHSTAFRRSVVSGRRSVDFISTSKDGPDRVITVHQEGHGGRKLPAPESTRTALGGHANSDFPTILAAHREMKSWRSLMLEPSAMRTPSKYQDSLELNRHGGNLANAVWRLTKAERRSGSVVAALANRLSTLLDDVRDLRVSEDDRFQTRTLEVAGRDGVFHPARALSDGTLRFLVLAALEIDSAARGTICLEEPENGIHPARVAQIVRLLRDIAVDSDLEVGPDNVLRQVVVNTHSPLVVQHTSPDELVYMEHQRVRRGGSIGSVAAVLVPEGSWRAETSDSPAQMATGNLLEYLGSPEKLKTWKQAQFAWTNAGVE